MSPSRRFIRAGLLVAAGALCLAACGGGGVSRAEAIDVLTRDDILSTSAAECVVDGIEESDKVSLEDLDKDDPGVEAAEATVDIIADCMLADGAAAAGGETASDVPTGSDDTAVQAAETTEATVDASDDLQGLSPDSPPPGTDSALDALWVRCADGSASACDELFFTSDIGSTYELFGNSCGGREITICSFLLGDDTEDAEGADGAEADGDGANLTDFADLSPSDPPPGDDAELDALWVECGEGSADACDRLFFESPSGGIYERFGFSCGGRAIASCEALLG